ncbi:Aquaporin SIP1-2 [Linum perenne]
MGAVKSAIGDMVMTFSWMFVSSMFGLFTSKIAITLGVEKIFWASLFITTLLISFFVFVFSFIAEFLGGASFNPTGNVSFYAAGVGGDSLFSLALRFPAQVMPSQYKHMLGGPNLKVDVHTGAIAEGVLTFLISFFVLVIITKGPRNGLVQSWLLAATTVSMVVAGSGYTGPSMNPANAFGWAYVNKWHNTWEHFYVYWLCPFVGAILGAWMFRMVFPKPSPPKQKKA